MAAIELDDQTAKELLQAAQKLGVSVETLVRSRVLGKSAPTPVKEGIDIDAEIDALAISVPPLPDGFSRADIYPDDC